jgi:hypothetical protein
MIHHQSKGIWHEPPGQPPQAGREEHESHDSDGAALPTAKPESSLLVAFPHFSQAGALVLRLLCSTSITCPHVPHRYSKIGISNSLFNECLYYSGSRIPVRRATA